mmetsp:Transcript_11940/g.14921  ORF Transcript_11940/g.14921 Transcript_11940/m.14921 type:complete len:206 (+) Transcript_11940:2253-2870(+)
MYSKYLIATRNSTMLHFRLVVQKKDSLLVTVLHLTKQIIQQHNLRVAFLLALVQLQLRKLLQHLEVLAEFQPLELIIPQATTSNPKTLQLRFPLEVLTIVTPHHQLRLVIHQHLVALEHQHLETLEHQHLVAPEHQHLVNLRLLKHNHLVNLRLLKRNHLVNQVDFLSELHRHHQQEVLRLVQLALNPVVGNHEKRDVRLNKRKI